MKRPLHVLFAALALGAATITWTAPNRPAQAASVTAIPADADWLTTVNHYRAMSGLPAVKENSTWSKEASLHSCWMLYNGMAHDEAAGTYGYTTGGDAAGNSSNIAMHTLYDYPTRQAVELWMTGPFHALGMLRPGWHTTGYGECHFTNAPKGGAGFTLDVIRGVDWAAKITTPILYPGAEATVRTPAFISEHPDPRTACGWSTTRAVGLPLLALMPETPTSVSASLTGPNGAVTVCPLTQNSPNLESLGQQLLASVNGVTVIPGAPLVNGRYTATVRTAARTVSWSFNVNTGYQGAATTLPATTTTATGTRFTAITPVRVASSVAGLKVGQIAANTVTPIQITGGTVPAGSAATVTVTARSAANGYLTLYPCTSVPPTNTVNFVANETTSNSATITLTAGGSTCVWATSATDITIDVTGVYGANGSYLNVGTPQRLIDTRTTATRLAGGTARSIPVAGRAGVPTGTRAAVLNVTAVNPAAAGGLTVYPCGTRPATTALTFRGATNRSATVHTGLDLNGNMCVYATVATDIVVDVEGYYATTGMGTSTVTPIRLIDTRSRSTGGLNGMTGGGAAYAPFVREFILAADRGIPTATAVTLNVITVNPPAAGLLTVYACGTAPATPAISFPAGRVTANSVTIKVRDATWWKTLCVKTTSDTHVIVELSAVHN